MLKLGPASVLAAIPKVTSASLLPHPMTDLRTSNSDAPSSTSLYFTFSSQASDADPQALEMEVFGLAAGTPVKHVTVRTGERRT